MNECNYECQKCSFFSNNITNYNLHLKTKKHKDRKSVV